MVTAVVLIVGRAMLARDVRMINERIIVEEQFRLYNEAITALDKLKAYVRKTDHTKHSEIDLELFGVGLRARMERLGMNVEACKDNPTIC